MIFVLTLPYEVNLENGYGPYIDEFANIIVLEKKEEHHD
jgi:hypothetical protein